jgi:hypothetical protein
MPKRKQYKQALTPRLRLNTTSANGLCGRRTSSNLPLTFLLLLNKKQSG